MIFSRVTACICVKNCTGYRITPMSSRRDRYITFINQQRDGVFFYIAGAQCAAARMREVCPHHIDIHRQVPIALNLMLQRMHFENVFILFGYMSGPFQGFELYIIYTMYFYSIVVSYTSCWVALYHSEYLNRFI